MRNLILLFCLLASVSIGQVAAPAKQLARYDRLIGSWSGSGESFMEAGGEPIPWTSVSVVSRVMSGHYLRDLTRIQLPMGTLAFITHTGWDAEAGSYAQFGISNIGQISRTTPHWIDENTVRTIEVTMEMDQQVVERWTTRIGKGEYSVLGERAVGGAEFFTHVKGTMHLMKTPPKGDLLGEVGAFMVSPSTEITRLNRMAGSYEVSGKFKMSRTMPAMEFSGNEIIKPLFGGMLLSFDVEGSGGYKAFAAIGWDAGTHRYKSLHLDNMSGGMISGLWWNDDTHLVGYGLLTMGHQPVFNRMVLVLDDKGRPISGSGTTLSDAGPAYESFTATYKRKN